MKNYKYISENTIQYIDLHDCECCKLYYKEASLILEMEWIEVLAGHPDNPHDKAYQSGDGVIRLKNPTLISGKYIASAGGEDYIVPDLQSVDISHIEILDFDESEGDDRFEAKIFGKLYQNKDYDFIELVIRYDKSCVSFDNLTEVSLFEYLEE